MTPSESDLLRLSLTAHDAAAEPSLWPEFLSTFAGFIGADIAIIQRHYFSQHRSEAQATFGMTRSFTAAYNQYYSSVNVWRENGIHLYVAGQTVIDPEMYPRALLKRSEFYNDCLLPNGSTHSLAGVVARSRDGALMLTALRHDRKEGWEARERPIVAALLPHMARAQQAVERMRLLDAGEAALNALNLGALLLDADGSVIFHNDAAAQAAIHAGDGLQLRNGKLNANNADADAGLQRLIAFALKPDGSLETPPDVLVPRQSLRQPYHVTALPIRRSLKPFVGIVRPVAVVIVNDPERRRPIGAEALRRGYGLTPREAALAVALADGWSLEQAADLLEMRYETARTHLRRVLSKTRTSRQAELLKLLAKFSV